MYERGISERMFCSLPWSATVTLGSHPLNNEQLLAFAMYLELNDEEIPI